MYVIEVFIILTGMLSIPELHFLLRVDTIPVISSGVVRYNENEFGLAEIRYLENVENEVRIFEASVLPIETKYSLNLSAISCLFVRAAPLTIIELITLFFTSVRRTFPINFQVSLILPAI